NGGDGLDGGRARGGFHRNEAISASSIGRTTTTGSTRPSTVATRRGVFRPGTNGGEKTNHRRRASGCLPWRWQRQIVQIPGITQDPRFREGVEPPPTLPIPVAEGAARAGLGQAPGSIGQIQSHNGNNGFSN
ncbi:unnamed protein product, partial [Musa hybrid cultivar]